MKTGFEHEVRSSLAGKPEPLFWYYISFANEASGAFLGAVVVEGPNDVKAALHEAFPLMPKGGKLTTRIEIPKDKLPAEQFRNRLLTRAEVETLWPGVKA